MTHHKLHAAAYPSGILFKPKENQGKKKLGKQALKCTNCFQQKHTEEKSQAKSIFKGYLPYLNGAIEIDKMVL